jgi:photosystem II stability/assembly factor-like uncharacterized protein
VSPRDGWLLGLPALVTHDGGATWSEDPRLNGVPVLEAVGDSIWAVRANCGRPYECVLELLVSPDRGAAWQPMSAPRSLHAGYAQPIAPGYRLQIVRVGLQDAWILAGGNEIPFSVSATHDGGMSWEEVTAPCQGSTNLLTAADATHVWFLCSNLAGAGSAEKSLYASADGGEEWRLIGDSALLAGPGIYNLPGMGYVRDFVAVSAQRAFIGHSRGVLVMTRDGGHTWTAPQLGPLGDGILQVIFVDEQHGWATERDAIWRTRDGGDTWERLEP